MHSRTKTKFLRTPILTRSPVSWEVTEMNVQELRRIDSVRALAVEATLPRAAFVAAIEGIAIEGGIVVDLHGRAIVGFALFGPGDIVSVNSRVTSLVTAVTLVDNFVFATFLRNSQDLRGATSPFGCCSPSGIRLQRHFPSADEFVVLRSSTTDGHKK